MFKNMKNFHENVIYLDEQSTPIFMTFVELESLFLKRDQLFAETEWKVLPFSRATLSA